jgi:DnaJ-domain-containing protein 1
MSKFTDIFDKYKHYDPETEGFGDVSQWQEAFEQKMGHDEAAKTIADQKPLEILGFKVMPTVHELKKRYRALMMVHHPDRGGEIEVARKIIAAFTLVMEELGD